MSVAPVRDTLRIRVLERAIRRATPLLRRIDVDPDALLVLLRVKATLERRVVDGMTPTTRVLRQAGLALMVTFYVHIGLALGGVSLLLDDPGTFGAIAGAAVAILVLMPVILDVGHLLLDSADLDVVATLPVTDRTVLAVRTLNLAGFTIVLYASLVLPALPFLPFAGWGPLSGPAGFLAVTALGAASAVTFLVATVLLALRWLGPSRVEDVVLTVQIGLLVVTYGATQVGPHLVDADAWLAWVREHPAVLALVPPVWSGAQMRLLAGDGRPEDFLPAAVGVGFALIVVVGLLIATGSGTVSRLLALGRHARRGPTRPRRFGITGRLGGLLQRSPVDRAGYRFFLACSSVDRTFRRRAYPTIVPLAFAVLPVLVLGKESLTQAFAPLPLAVFGMLPIVALDQGRYSENAAARWLFDTTTASDRGRFARGAGLAPLVRLWLLPTVVYLPVAAYLTEGRNPEVLVLGALVGAGTAVAAVRRLTDTIPFTVPVERIQAGALSGTVIVFSVLSVAASAMVVVAALVPYGGWVGCALLGPLVVREAVRLGRTPPDIPPIPVAEP